MGVYLPIKPVSQPKSMPPNEATAVSVYVRRYLNRSCHIEFGSTTMGLDKFAACGLSRASSSLSGTAWYPTAFLEPVLPRIVMD